MFEIFNLRVGRGQLLDVLSKNHSSSTLNFYDKMYNCTM